MESKDIIKALEYCTSLNADCRHCDKKITENCITFLMRDALGLIKNQQAEIEKLREEKEVSNSELAKAINKSLEQAKEIGDLKAECVKTHFACIGIKKCYSRAKTEAYKEFADRLKQRATLTQQSLTGNCWYEVDKRLVDNVLKELTERKEDEGK